MRYCSGTVAVLTGGCIALKGYRLPTGAQVVRERMHPLILRVILGLPCVLKDPIS